MPQKRILWLTTGDQTIASSRVRSYALATECERRGYEVLVIPTMGLDTKSLLRTLAPVMLRKWDAIVLQKITPNPIVLKMVKQRSHTLVFECDDAIQLGYPGEGNSEVERRKVRLEQLKPYVSHTVVSTDALARSLWPDVKTKMVFPGPAPAARRPTAEKDKHQIVWEGSAATEQYLSLVAPAVEELRDRYTFVAVGATDAVKVWGFEPVQWAQATHEEWLNRSVVGLMPSFKDEWSDHKAGYKALEYLASAVVPVFTPSPAATAALGNSGIGVAAAGPEDWAPAIEKACSIAEEPSFADQALQRLTELSATQYCNQWLNYTGLAQ